MNNTHDDRHLHLVRVGKDQSVVRAVPIGVQTKRIYLASRLGSDESRLVGPFPARLPDVERFRKDVVVHEPSVDREKTHENDNVSTAKTSALALHGRQGTDKKKISIISCIPDLASFFSNIIIPNAVQNAITP